MKASPLALLVILAWTIPAWATDRYVDSTTSGCSTPTDTDFNPATESCGSGAELVYNSVPAAVSASAGGDNIYILAGTYNVALNNTLPSGPSSSQKTQLWAYNGQAVTFRTPVGATNGNGIAITSRSNISIKQIIIDNTDVKLTIPGKATLSRGFPFRITGSIASPAANIDLDGVRATNGGIGMFTAHVHSLHVTRSRFDHNGHDEFDHGIYTDNGTNDAIIEYSEFDHNSQMGAQLYKFPSRMQFRNNYVHDNCQITNSGSEVYLSGVDNVLERNVVTSDGSCTSGVTLNTGSSTSPTRNTLRHNSLYCKTGSCPNYGLNIASASVSNSVLQNNIALGYGTNLRNLGASTTLTDNLTSGTASAIWTDPTAGNLTLKAGSVAIDGGTPIGLSANGGTPEQGAYEVPIFSSCEVRNGEDSKVRVRFTNNLRPPMLPASSVTGVTFRKNGASNAVVSSVRVGDNEYDFTVTTAFIPGDPVDMSIVPASTNLTDSALIGNSSNQQFLSTITNQTCTNSLSGGSAEAINQIEFRFHYAYGLEASPRIRPTGDTIATAGTVHRLRIKLTNTASDPIATGFQLRVSYNGGAYVAVTNSYVNHVKMYAQFNSKVPAGVATTRQLPQYYATFLPGLITDTANAVPNIDFTVDSETELEYVLEYESSAVLGDRYDYRLYHNDGSPLSAGGAYVVTPQVTIAEGESAL